MGIFDVFRAIGAANICADASGILEKEFGVDAPDEELLFVYKLAKSSRGNPTPLYIALVYAAHYGWTKLLEGTACDRTLCGLRWLSIARYLRDKNVDCGGSDVSFLEVIKTSLELHSSDLDSMQTELAGRLPIE